MLLQRDILSLFSLVVCVGPVCGDTASILTNAYAKVAKWGASLNLEDLSKNSEEGRSNGQAFYTQSSDVKLRSGQNLKNNDKVVYHYAMPSENILTSKVDLPKKMGGFQDRFNPPPAFQFGDSGKKDVPGGQDHDHSHDHSHHEGPVYVPPKQVSYDSPISSYNPIASGLPDSDKYTPSGTKYPPINPGPPSPVSSASTGPSKGFKGPLVNPDYDSDGPDGGNDGYQYAPPSSGYPGSGSASASPMLPTPVPPAPSSKPPSIPNLQHKFPSYVYNRPPADYDDPPDHDQHHHHYHDHNQPPPSGQDQNQGPSGPPSDTSGPQDPLPNSAPSDYSDSDYPHEHHDHRHDHKPSLGDLPEYLDHDPSHQSKFNNFPLWSNLYEDHHVHHPVYHPVITTTTPQPPPKMEDEKRVNKGHYSYYYLGRKLYYVPLYFSVYFIIYITVLILKSIARHKVNFVHELDHVNKGRSLDINASVLNSSVVDEVEENTTRAIMQFKRRFIAM